MRTKYFLLGFISVIVLKIVVQVSTSYDFEHGANKQSSLNFFMEGLLTGRGAEMVLTKYCVKDLIKVHDPDGVTRNYVKREWFKCNQVQNFFSDLIYE